MAAALSLNKGKRDGEEVKAKQPARAMIIAQLEREIKEHLITTNKVNIRRSVALRQLTERLTDQEAVLKMEQAAMESLPSRHHLDVFAPPLLRTTTHHETLTDISRQPICSHLPLQSSPSRKRASPPFPLLAIMMTELTETRRMTGITCHCFPFLRIVLNINGRTVTII